MAKKTMELEPEPGCKDHFPIFANMRFLLTTLFVLVDYGILRLSDYYIML